MSLEIIVGRGGSGKSTYMLNNMTADSDTLYIVPEQFSFSAEKKIIDIFGMVGLGNPEVLSFMRLSDIIFSKYGSVDFISDTASYEMLVSYCANSIRPEKLRLFDGLVKKSELAQTASNVITTFKRYCITPERLSSAIERTDDNLLKKKLSDSLTLYSEYLTALSEANISDRNDTLSVLAAILSDDKCDFLEGKKIYIDQFSDFDPSEYLCIKAMLRRATKVSVSLCYDENLQFETIKRTYNRLLSAAKECGCIINETVTIPDAVLGASPMIKHLEKSYFEDVLYPFCGSDGCIKIHCAKNRNSEMHKVSEEIVKLVRDEGYRYKDISVIARDAEIYKEITERTFPIYDIPAFVDRKLPLSGHSITLFVTSVLDIAVSGFSYENVFSYIKNPISPLTTDEADEIENYCLRAGIRPYSWSKPFTAGFGAYVPQNSQSKDGYSEEKLEMINAIREKVYLPLSELIKKLKRKATVSDFCGYLFEFFEYLELEKRIRREAIGLEERGENLHALQTIQVYNILVDIFNDICAVLGNKELSLQEFRQTVLAGLKAVEIGTIPSSQDCVTVGSIDRIKGHGARVVFLVGVNSGVFPQSPTEGGLFTDDDKIILSELGIEMPPTLSELSESEQLLIYDALTCASDKLYLSYASSDNSSNALMPSEIIEKVSSMFPDAPYTDESMEGENLGNSITTKKAVFDLLASKLHGYIVTGEPLPPQLSAAAYYFTKDEQYAPLLENAISMTSYKEDTVRVYPSLIKKVIGDDMKTSITRLELYNKCPFSYFAKYILKLEPRQVFEVTPSDSGSFLHDFLDKFSEFIINSVDKNNKPYTWKTIDDDFIKLNTPVVLREVLSSVNTAMLEIPRIKALFDRLCRSAQKAVFSVRRHIVNSDFIPLGYEISFDEDGTFKPINIILDDGKQIVLRGRIDRADEFTLESDTEGGKFVRIVDYKSSEKTLSLSDVYNGIQLQLFVYLSTLCDNGYKPAGILYCNLSDPIIEVVPGLNEDEIIKKRYESLRMNGIILSENEMDEHMGGKELLKTKKTASYKDFNNMFLHLKKLIKRTAQNIYSGKFPVKCSKDGCLWCEYAQLCRYDTSIESFSEEEVKLKDNEIWTLLEESKNEMDS